MKKFFFLTVLLICLLHVTAQKKLPPQLATQLTGKTKFREIKSTVENYYKTEKNRIAVTDTISRKKIERQRKFWNRDLYWMEGHTDANGNVADANKLTYEYLKQETTVASLTSYGNWQPIGPFSLDAGIGRVNRIAFHPTNANIIYAGTPQAGLWKTTNGGNSWTCISNFLPSLGISGIVIDKVNPNIIYVLTGDGDAATGGFTDRYGYIRFSQGVFKTTNGGDTWNKMTEFPGLEGLQYVTFNLAVSSQNNNLLLAATNGGLFRSNNGGNTWTHCNIVTPSASDDFSKVWDVVFKPGSSDVAYCTVAVSGGSQFFRSTDGGLTFTTNNTVSYSPATFNTSAQRIKIAVSPNNSNYVYLLAGPGNVISQTFKGVWRSTNSGASFTRRASSPDILGYQDIINDFDDQNTYDLALAANPADANMIITGGLVAWRSEDGGTTYNEIVDYFEDADNSNYIHSDIHDLQYNPLDGKLWAATDGGVASSTDNGDNWTRHFTMNISAFYHYKPSNQDNLRWGGTQDNGTMLQISGNSYYKFDGGDGYDVMTDKAPAGNNNDDYWVINKTIWTDGIGDIEITPPLSDNFFPNLDMCPNDEDIIYAGYNKFWISPNRGDDWIDVPVTHGGSAASYAAGNWCVATCPSDPSRVYCAGDNGDEDRGFFRIIDANTTNPQADYHVPEIAGSSNKITDITVNENNANIVWLTLGGFDERKKVFRSTNGGQTWSNQSSNLPNLPVNCILLDGNSVYIGTDIGVYYKNFGTDTSWTPFYNGLPRVPVSQMHKVFLPSTNQFYIEASTFGRGLWRSEIFGTCTSNITVTANLQGQQFYQAGTSLSSTSVVSGGAGTNVFFQSGNAVTLTPGFHAESGNYFKAYVLPCNSGLPAPLAPQTAPKKTKRKNTEISNIICLCLNIFHRLISIFIRLLCC